MAIITILAIVGQAVEGIIPKVKGSTRISKTILSCPFIDDDDDEEEEGWVQDVNGVPSGIGIPVGRRVIRRRRSCDELVRSVLVDFQGMISSLKSEGI
jgi:hypothetical protein